MSIANTHKMPDRMIWDSLFRKRFFARIKKDCANGCHEWQGCCAGRGYGVVTLDYTSYLVHRVVWFITHGELPTHLYVCHTCDNIKCCNPEHLFLGTAADNMKDMSQKGRHRWAAVSA